MFPLQNEHVDVIEYNHGDPFKGMYVEQVIRARDSVFDEMRKAMGIGPVEEIRAAHMGKKSITKDKLMDWLETVCCILDIAAVPLLGKGIDLKDRVEKLQEEKIVDQDTIIKLQARLIEKKDEEMSLVKTTVQSEMKSYSSVLSKSCSAALAPKKIQAAVKRVAENSDRQRNVVIYGVEEKEGELLETKVGNILAEIDERPRVQNACRIGRVDKEKCRPIKFTLPNSDHVNEILRKSKRLRTKVGFKSVYICPDRSVDERKAFKKLLEELRSKRIADPDGVYMIKNNKVVRTERDSEPVNNG